MTYKMIQVPDEDSISDSYICPCGGAVLLGLQHPTGDYDDWVYYPRCLNCGLESGSGKTPYDVFLEKDDYDAGSKIGFYKVTFKNGSSQILQFDADNPPGENPARWGCGGTMWKEASWELLKDIIIRPSGISDREWQRQVNDFMEKLR